MNLECSSRGDKRFSALYAKVLFNGIYDTIENHYQKSKRKLDNMPVKKGERPDYIIVSDYKLPISYLTPFYKLLWYIYLEKNKELAKYASSFTSFSDMFKGKKTVNSQANVIEEYVFNKKKLIEDISPILPYVVSKRNQYIYDYVPIKDIKKYKK